MRTISIFITSVVIAALFATAFAPSTGNGQAQEQKPKPAPTLDDLVSGRLSIVDLTWTLDDQIPYWPNENHEPFRLKTIATIEQNGLLAKTFFTPEHFGTHIDAPNHFEKNQPSVDEIKPRDLIGPGVVIDISRQAESDEDYRLTVADLAAWEKEHGRIPDGAIVLLNTGWGRYWTNYSRFKNQDATGKLHFPGYSEAAARWLVTERKARCLGTDTLSIDYGPAKDHPVHHVVNGAGLYALENVARLEQLPARDFYVFVAPVKIRTGSGSPTRITAAFRPGEKPRDQ